MERGREAAVATVEWVGGGASSPHSFSTLQFTRERTRVSRWERERERGGGGRDLREHEFFNSRSGGDVQRCVLEGR